MPDLQESMVATDGLDSHEALPGFMGYNRSIPTEYPCLPTGG